MRQLAHGSLFHHSIPLADVRTIADVATGTGIWLRETAQELATSGGRINLMGFEISAQQFPKDEIPRVKFIEHSVVRPFPPEHHGNFDVVNIRLLSYALKAQDLKVAVRNISQILRE